MRSKSVQLSDKPFAGLIMGETMVSGRGTTIRLSLFWSIQDSEFVNSLGLSDLVGSRLGHRIGRYSVLRSLSIKIKFSIGCPREGFLAINSGTPEDIC